MPTIPDVSNISLDAAGLVALADLNTIKQRTALTGTSVWLDALVIAPGIHQQQHAPDLAGGEWPAAAAMTTSYPFRIENPATVYWLQNISVTGHLTTVQITHFKDPWYYRLLFDIFPFRNASLVSALAYMAAVAGTVVTLNLLAMWKDWWGIGAFGLLILARLINIVIIRRRSKPGWKGAQEEGHSDLIVLLSQDRWVRIQGTVNDTKLVTSGQWLRDQTMFESWFSALATLIVYLDAVLVSNVSQNGKVLLIILLVCSSGLLAIANATTAKLHIFGRILSVDGDRKKYERRTDLAKALIKEVKTDEWAMRLGMIKSTDRVDLEVPIEHEKVTM